MKDLEEKAFNDSKSTDSRTMELIALAQNGDSSAKEKLLLENSGLILCGNFSEEDMKAKICTR